MNNTQGVYRPINPTSKTTAASFPYTAPADGVWIGTLQPSGAIAMYAIINGTSVAYGFSNSDGYNQNKSSVTIPLLKGDTLAFTAAIRITYSCEFYTYR